MCEVRGCESVSTGGCDKRCDPQGTLHLDKATEENQVSGLEPMMLYDNSGRHCVKFHHAFSELQATKSSARAWE